MIDLSLTCKRLSLLAVFIWFIWVQPLEVQDYASRDTCGYIWRDYSFDYCKDFEGFLDMVNLADNFSGNAVFSVKESYQKLARHANEMSDPFQSPRVN